MRAKEPIYAPVEPPVLKWAVESSGWTAEDVSRRLKISPKTVEAWFGGSISPTVPQLENLATALKRPLAAFFLSKPPAEKPNPPDYRMLPGKEGIFDKKTLLAIRRARRLQRTGRELTENLNEGMQEKFPKVQMNENPSKLAASYRHEFGLDEETQRKMKDPYKLLNYLREKIEARGVMSFQISMPLEDARGLTLADESPAVVVINSKDPAEARIFTLMHEFAHVLLGESGVSMPQSALMGIESKKIERWCDQFAANFLFPQEIAKGIFTEKKKTLTDTDTLNSLARAYKVSKAMLLRCMLDMGFVDKTGYDKVLGRYDPSGTMAQPSQKKSFKRAPGADKRCLNEKGHRFVSLVISNMERGFITHSDTLNYLSIKSKNLDKVMKEVRG